MFLWLCYLSMHLLFLSRAIFYCLWMQAAVATAWRRQNRNPESFPPCRFPLTFQMSEFPEVTNILFSLRSAISNFHKNIVLFIIFIFIVKFSKIEVLWKNLIWISRSQRIICTSEQLFIPCLKLMLWLESFQMGMTVSSICLSFTGSNLSVFSPLNLHHSIILWYRSL